MSVPTIDRPAVSVGRADSPKDLSAVRLRRTLLLALRPLLLAVRTRPTVLSPAPRQRSRLETSSDARSATARHITWWRTAA
jgi:hypothetical protein